MNQLPDSKLIASNSRIKYYMSLYTQNKKMQGQLAVAPILVAAGLLVRLVAVAAPVPLAVVASRCSLPAVALPAVAPLAGVATRLHLQKQRHSKLQK